MNIAFPPPSPEVARLVQIMGVEAALAVVEQWGGTRLYVPKAPAGESELVKAVGDGPAKALAEAFGGEYLKVPLARRWRILAYHAMSLSYAQIARRAGCTEKHVGETLRGEGLTRAQLDLFQD